MNIPQLQYFQTVAEYENYSKAAQKLNITQPALSRMIANLEQELGVELFRKKGRGVELSIYGKILLEHVNSALDSIADAERKIKLLISPKTGHLRIASLYTLGINFVPFLIKNFVAENPLVTFSYYQQPTRLMLNMLRNGEIDLGFCTDFSGPEDSQEFEKATILIEDLYILVNKSHRLAQRREVSLAELKDESWIFFNNDTYFKRPALEIFDKVGYRPNIVFEANEDSTVAGLVAADLGIAIVPPVVGTDLDKCVPLKISYPVCQRTLCMAWPKRSQGSPIIDKFREYVFKWLPENKKLKNDHYVLKHFSRYGQEV